MMFLAAAPDLENITIGNAAIVALLVAFSRLYLYLHYPTDVFASIILGSLFGVLGYMLAQKCNLRNPFSKGKYQK